MARQKKDLTQEKEAVWSAVACCRSSSGQLAAPLAPKIERSDSGASSARWSFSLFSLLTNGHRHR
ncbi:MAG TPA: hypothetical protein PK468_19340, partial [Candidatus Hydrogenedentes bacterium]|nr:hypothetical protein [Candidatus Hydrogenedentota bacterium]